ncbi:DUF3176 domain protein [Colletotrichum scovillei]|uniref:DUF3176 domain protein n=1 Tax=Colletotrichum scovillei TaxID=1209932 RepID=A0A9P7RHH4_9PEZI|nr:DUF3176 domain protein [Colletotrichum scovillei]KAG7075132.1 DUF3176 domain protein [Colletotrichum scovillei]
MQANEEQSQAMSPDAHLQQPVPMVSSNQCSPESASEVKRSASPRLGTPPATPHPTAATETHESTMLNPEAEIMASETSPVSSQETRSINLNSHQNDSLSILGAGIRRKPISITTYTSAQQTPEEPYESPQPTSASAERLDEIKRTSEVLKPTWKIWALEMSCIAVSTLLLAVIIFVLLRYDSQEQPDWPLGATLNSFLALFTTLAKAAFMVPVCTCISQSQWAWFSKNGVSRPLYDFEVIDQASRGAWGSLILLWRFRFRHFVVLGALLTAISALTSPITQLSIKYSLKEVPVAKEATESQATTLVVRDLMSTRDNLGAAIRFAIYQTSFQDYEKFEKPLPYAAIDTNATFCSTSNCTFDQYQSLGICVKMANITSSLKVERFADGSMTETPVLGNLLLPNSSVWKLSLPGGFTFDHQSKFALFTSMLNGNHTIAFQHRPAVLRARIASFFLIYTTPILTESDKTWWESQKNLFMSMTEAHDHVHSIEHEAVEILFHLCVQSYTTTVQLEFSANYQAMEAISLYTMSYFTGFAFLVMHPTIKTLLPVRIKGSGFIDTLHSLLFSQFIIPTPERRKLCLENIYKNAATLMSASFRMNRPYNQWTKGVFNVPGQATTMVTYVNIRWPWVMLLAAEIAVSTVFLVITIIYYTGGSDSQYRDLKSSSLGTLVALGPDCHTAAGGGLQPVDALKKLAKGVQVQLIGNQIVIAEDETGQTPSQETACGVSCVAEGASKESDCTQG